MQAVWLRIHHRTCSCRDFGNPQTLHPNKSEQTEFDGFRHATSKGMTKLFGTGQLHQTNDVRLHPELWRIVQSSRQRNDIPKLRFDGRGFPDVICDDLSSRLIESPA